ncbi:phosphotransferase family protein [Salinispora cortesiana]|uniref:phosphotransferase family protein n=1 Tax=Salinispora cortesiana TaxID=1305843 RepID=UPI00040A6338|nr:phosphotransferase [Salinispora cortesiana]
MAADPSLLGAPWLERDGYAAYAHHVAAGHHNLSLLGVDPRLASLFSPGRVRRLHACLDALDRLIAEAGRIIPTLLHGDLHVHNLGLADDRRLVLIDWEHVGTGPVGIDLAMFVSLYQLFGGAGELDERALLTDYATGAQRGRRSGPASAARPWPDRRTEGTVPRLREGARTPSGRHPLGCPPGADLG